MKVSFDFDGTLSRKDVQEFVTYLVSLGVEVWIVTSRCDTELALSKGWYWVENQNKELYEVAELCGILIERIKFTEFVDKIDFLEGRGFLFHLDDDPDELWEIVKSGDLCKAVNIEHFEWRNSCLEALGIGGG